MIENDPMWKQLWKEEKKILRHADYYFIAVICFTLAIAAYLIWK